MEETIISGKETSKRISVNFIPKKEASNIVIGIRQTETAPRYVKIILNLAPFLYNSAAIGKATYNPPAVVLDRIIAQKNPIQLESLPKCFSIVSRFIQTSNKPIKINATGTILSIDKANERKFFPIASPTS